MTSKHAVLWVDHTRGQLVVLHADDPGHDAVEVLAPPKAEGHEKRERDGHRDALDRVFAEALGKAIGDVEEVLLVGPGSAKDELLTILRKKHPAIAKRILGVEPSDHAGPGELNEHGRRFFRGADRMLGRHVG